MLCTEELEKECLPDIIECENLIEWNSYLEKLYDNIFKPQFIDTKPTFKGWRVLSRKEPKDGIWEHGFTHMTHVNLLHTSDDPNNRIPDLRRSERLNWVKPIIQNYECSLEKNCGKILYWEEMFRGRVRCNLLFKEERFHIVLEQARDVYFIITSFYVEKDWELNKRIKKYEVYKKQKTPLA
jgi:hypothetical protein